MNTGCQEKRPKNQREQTDGWAPCFRPCGWLEPKESGYRGQVSVPFPAQIRSLCKAEQPMGLKGSNQGGKHTAVWSGFPIRELAAVSPVLEWTLASFTCILREGLRF